MSDPSRINDLFLNEITAVVERNIADEHFGVSELAGEMHMSRSNLLRKVKKETKLSVSQLINQIRLKRAMELLRKSSMNVFEVSQQVGFNSASYFIKCFREYYGYPPGEVGKRDNSETLAASVIELSRTTRGVLWASAALMVFLVIAFAAYKQWPSSAPQEKSIVVLPFKNDSSDSTNLYLINGLMESTLLNLQQIKDLKVISRTSSEKYRNTTKSIPEISQELNVRYFVEGSGQKIGDRILLNIQLIEGSTDRHLWGRQYKREAEDIFALQREVAKDIADEIRAVITPEEEKRIEKIPTEDLEAYNWFLKGRDHVYFGSKELARGVSFLRKAIERDPKFAEAYANASIALFLIDLYQTEKKHTKDIESYADKALLYDPKLAESLLAKAFSYVHKKEYSAAVPYFEKALEYNPNSDLVIGSLSDFYANYLPNTAKYLEYALKAVRLDIGTSDSVTASYNYLRLGNALVQSGFVDESLRYIDKSLDYFPGNAFSRYVRAFILYAKDGDLPRTRQLLIEEFNKDTTRFDILQDIGKVSYYLHDFDGAYKYYKRFLRIRETGHLDVYRHENLLISIVLGMHGEKEKAAALLKDYKDWLDQDQSIYKNLGYTGYYTHLGDTQKAMDHYKLFAEEDNYQYWIILFSKKDPQLGSLSKLPEFVKITHDIEKKFWSTHETLKRTLEEKGVM